MNILAQVFFWLIALIVSFIGLISFKDHEVRHWMSYLTLFVYSSIMFISSYRILHFIKIKNQFKTNAKALACLIGLLLIAGLHYFSHIHLSSIWLDEATQATHSIFKYDIVLLASYHQQPPLFYNLISFALNTFGLSETALRTTSVILMMLSCLFLFLFLFKLTQKYLLSFSMAVLYLSNPYVSWYAVEARPYALAVLFFITSIYFITEKIQSENENIDKLIVSFLLFSLSINFQPQVFFATLCVTFLVLYRKLKYFKILFIFFFIFLILSPLFYKIFSATPSNYTKNVLIDFDLVNYFSDSFQLIKTSLMSFGFTQNRTTYFLVFSITNLLSFLVNRKEFINKNFYFLLFLFHLIINAFAFELLINWNYQVRYSICLIPIFILSLAVSLDILINRLKYKKLYYIVILFNFAYFIDYNQYSVDKINYGNWRELHKELDLFAQDNSVAYTLFINEKNSYEVDGFIGSYFYTSKKIKLDEYGYADLNYPSSIFYVYRDLEAHLEPKEIYFVQNTIHSHFNLSESFISDNNLNYKKIFEFEIIKLKNEKEFYNTLLNFYLILEKNSTKDYAFLNIYKALMYLYLFKDDCFAAKNYYEDLVKISQEAGKTFTDVKYNSKCLSIH